MPNYAWYGAGMHVHEGSQQTATSEIAGTKLTWSTAWAAGTSDRATLSSSTRVPTLPSLASAALPKARVLDVEPARHGDTPMTGR